MLLHELLFLGLSGLRYGMDLRSIVGLFGVISVFVISNSLLLNECGVPLILLSIVDWNFNVFDISSPLQNILLSLLHLEAYRREKNPL